MRLLRRLFTKKPCNGFILRDEHGIPLGSATGLATEGVMFVLDNPGVATDVVRIPEGIRYPFEHPWRAKAGEHVLFTLNLEV